jgi:DNA-directed RNA polymerase subunit RPC12/RpoP
MSPRQQRNPAGAQPGPASAPASAGVHLKDQMDDSVQIHCVRCKSTFRDRAMRLQPGYARQCPSCEVVIFFEESSSDKNVKRALLTARRLRRVLREHDEIKLAARQPPVYDRTS